VPGSSAFAGEFLILTGVFTSGWGWSVVGAAAMVLAAMYMLRLISAVLHRAKGSAVSDSARDLRLPELALLAPLVVLLIFLSAWPAAITDHTFGQRLHTPGLARLASAPRTRAHTFETVMRDFAQLCGHDTYNCVVSGTFEGTGKR
jgi:hypothetical protein